MDRRFRHLRILLVLACASPPAPLPGAEGKREVPAPEAIARAEQVVRDLYADEYAAAVSSRQKSALAQKLLTDAAEARGDVAGYFVLLRVSRDVAVQAGDAEVAVDAIDSFAESFEAEPLAMKLEALRAVGQAASSTSQYAELASQTVPLVDQALEENRYDLAADFAEVASEAARRGRDSRLATRLAGRISEIREAKQAFDRFRQATEKLESTPSDPEANLVVGRYLCLVQADWETGLPKLAAGADPKLKAAAEKDLAGAATPEEMAAIGHAWWDLAGGAGQGERNPLLQRAASWYQQALPQLSSGLTKVLISKRLEEVGGTGETSAESSLPVSETFSLEPSDEWFDTGIDIVKGRVYEITASGRWQGSDGLSTGPEGLATTAYADSMGPFKEDPVHGKHRGQHYKNSLIGTCGDWQYTFYIGPGCRFLAPHSGPLRLKINDDPDATGRRIGKLTVIVSPVEHFSWAGRPGIFEFAARSDTVDELHITREGLWWVHTGTHTRVGQHSGYYPTIVNGTYWWPEWKTAKRSEILSSSHFFPSAGRKLVIQEVVSPRAGCRITAEDDQKVVFTIRSNGLGSVGVRVICRYQ